MDKWKHPLTQTFSVRESFYQDRRRRRLVCSWCLSAANILHFTWAKLFIYLFGLWGTVVPLNRHQNKHFKVHFRSLISSFHLSKLQTQDQTKKWSGFIKAPLRCPSRHAEPDTSSGWRHPACFSLSHPQKSNSPLEPLRLCLRYLWGPPPPPSASARPADEPGAEAKYASTPELEMGFWYFRCFLLQTDLLTLSNVPMSGLCHVSILIMKSSFMYSFWRENMQRGQKYLAVRFYWA